MGALWMLTEPLVGVIVMGLLLGPLIGRAAPDMPYAFFLLNGFVMLQAFTRPMAAGMSALGANQGLLVFPKVQPLDLLLARFIFELSTSLMSFTIFCLAGMWVGVVISLGHLHVLLATFILTWLIGCGVGMILCVGVAYFQSVEKVLVFVRRPLLFISCVLHPLYAMPNFAQKLLLYNPLVHTIETSRKCLFPLYRIGEANLIYPSIWAIVLFAIGLSFFHKHRHFLAQP
jgi:capsular polysaccharide transport system permease protein